MSELLQEARRLWDVDDKLDKFGSRFNVYPLSQAEQMHEGMSRLREQIPGTATPQTKDELHQSELKRILGSKIISFERFLSGKLYTLEDIIGLYGLEAADLANLRPWLLANRVKTVNAVERLFTTSKVESAERPLSFDIPRIRQQAEGFAASQVTNYHQKLGLLFEGLTSVGNYLHRITSEASTTDRSYFNPKARRLALGISDICYEVEDGTIQLREGGLLRLFGHEGMGHALQRVITDSIELPFFLKDGTNASMAADEAIAQHYERVIFEDLKNSPRTQKDLRIADRFDELYQEELDTRQIKDYNKNLFHYGILVLADKTLGGSEDPEVIRRKIELLGEVALMPTYAVGFIEGNRYNYDSQGNLSSGLTSELRYSSEAIQRALEIFQAHGFHYDNKDQRSHIDMTFLTGYYTPIGFVQKAELAAEGKI